MSDSILLSTKHVLGLSDDYDIFDEGIIMHINMALASAESIGCPISVNAVVEDETALWSSLDLPHNQLNILKNYVYLKARLMFDPPTTSYLIEALNKQVAEIEYRMHVLGRSIA